MAATRRKTLLSSCLHEPKLDPLYGLEFRNVLGDALCAERGLARRLPRVTPWRSRHRVRPELVLLLRGSSGAAVHSRVGRGDDIARSTRSSSTSRARECPIRSPRARCRPWSNGPTASPQCWTISRVAKRSSSRTAARSQLRHCSPRHIHLARQRLLCSRGSRIRWLNAPMGSLQRICSMPRSRCGERGSCNVRSIRTCRGTRRSGQRGPGWNVWRRAPRR